MTAMAAGERGRVAQMRSSRWRLRGNAGKICVMFWMEQKACDLASEAGDQGSLKENQELLELYRKHQPYHASTENLARPAP